MTAREMATELEKQGHKVKFTIRKDGSIKITEIDGIKFQDSQGNAHARKVLGVSLTPRQQAQLDKIKLAKGQQRKKKKKPAPTEEEKDLRRRLRRTQRIWRENNQQGTITWKNVAWTLHHFGYREAKERLEQSERYAKGLAYPQNLQAFADRIRSTMDKLSGKERHYVYEIWKFITQRIHADVITEYQLQLLIEKWYDYADHHTLTVEQWYDVSHTILLAENAGRAHREYYRRKHTGRT